MTNLSDYGKKISVVMLALGEHIETMEAKHTLPTTGTSEEWADAKRDAAISADLGQQYCDLLQEISEGLDAGEIT